MDDRRKKGEFVGALGALLVHVAVIALLILVSFTVPQPDEDAGGVPVMLGNVESARGFDDPSLVDVDILPEEPEAPAPAETQPELPSEQDLLTQTEEETVVLKPKTEPKKETVKPKEVVKPKEPVKKPEKTEAEKAAEAKRLAEEKAERERKAAEEAAKKKVANAFADAPSNCGVIHCIKMYTIYPLRYQVNYLVYRISNTRVSKSLWVLLIALHHLGKLRR